MNIENHVTTLEESRRLKELGVPQESQFWWSEWNDNQTSSISVVDAEELLNNRYLSKICSAFLVSELGEMLYDSTDIRLTQFPIPTRINKGGKLTKVWKIPNDQDYIDYFKGVWGTTFSSFIFSDTEASARAKMLIYLIENKLLDPKDL